MEPVCCSTRAFGVYKYQGALEVVEGHVLTGMESFHVGTMPWNQCSGHLIAVETQTFIYHWTIRSGFKGLSESFRVYYNPPSNVVACGLPPRLLSGSIPPSILWVNTTHGHRS